MAASFCAYVRKMTELQILPLLDFSNVQISQNFFDSIKSAADMMNTKLIIGGNKNQISEFITRPRTVQEDDAITEQFRQQSSRQETIQGEDWRIFMPIISPFDNTF
jgi:hypothetical protein